MLFMRCSWDDSTGDVEVPTRHSLDPYITYNSQKNNRLLSSAVLSIVTEVSSGLPTVRKFIQGIFTTELWKCWNIFSRIFLETTCDTMFTEMYEIQ